MELQSWFVAPAVHNQEKSSKVLELYGHGLLPQQFTIKRKEARSWSYSHGLLPQQLEVRIWGRQESWFAVSTVYNQDEKKREILG